MVQVQELLPRSFVHTNTFATPKNIWSATNTTAHLIGKVHSALTRYSNRKTVHTFFMGKSQAIEGPFR